MPLLRINATPQGLFGPGRMPVRTALQSAFKDLPDTAPVIILIHGFKFSPSTVLHSPHRHILALTPRSDDPKAISWPAHLGFGRDNPDEGLCIALGWEGRGSIWQAYQEARRAGQDLAKLVNLIQARHRGPISLMGHSLGARVALCAISELPARSVQRALLLSPAEFRDKAHNAVQSPAGRTCEFININSRENDIFDYLLETFIRPLDIFSTAIGQGFRIDHRNWIDIQIDDTHTRRALADLGYQIPAPSGRICHWSGYLRPGLLSLHRALLRNPERLPIRFLKIHLPRRRSWRWSRLLTPRLQLPNLPGQPRPRP